MKRSKKVFFILDWDFALVLAPIAQKLVNEKIIDEDVNCLNVGRNYYKYLHDGSIEHPFKKIYSLDEVYETKIYDKKIIDDGYNQLKKQVSILEKKYGNLWLYVWADRNHIKDEYRTILNEIVVFFEYFENLYQTEKPDLIITNAYASMPHLISYEVAINLGIKIVNPELLRVEKKSFLSTDQYRLMDKYVDIGETHKKEAKEIIDNYRQNFDKPFYEKKNEKRKKDIFAGVKRLLNYSYNYYITKLYTGHTKPNPFKKLLDTEIKPRLNKYYFNKFYNFEKQIETSENYIYFPLHLQPEATTMTNAPFYLNQLLVIETLSKSIPMDYRLYVKEHPNMFGNNTRYFYDSIKKLPNVKLFHPSVNSKDMIRNCKAVVTITGTVGLEGLILKKPVLTIGEVFFNDCSLVKQLKDIALTKWYDSIIKYIENYDYDEEFLVEFIAKVLAQSYDMIFVEPGYYNEVLEEQNMHNLIEAIKNQL